ncbi:hypothetical protein AAZX31_09G144100 [Glycine max]
MRVIVSGYPWCDNSLTRWTPELHSRWGEEVGFT